MARIALAFLLTALIGGTWWIGARSAPAQITVLGLAMTALLLMAISSSAGAKAQSSATSLAVVIVGAMLVFLAMQAIRIANPAFTVLPDGIYWRLISLPHAALLPTGFNAPFDGQSSGDLSFTNPLRHLVVFAAASSATIAAFLIARSSALRRGMLWAFVIQAFVISIVSIAHRLSGANHTLWFYEEMEFWLGSPVFPYKNSGAAYQVLLIGACMAMFRSVRDRGGKKTILLWLTGTITVLAVIALLLLNSRAGVIMGVVMVGLFVFQECLARGVAPDAGNGRWVVALGVAALMAGGGWVLARGGFASTIQRFETEIFQPIVLLRGGMPRIQKQRVAIAMTMDRPWLGWGGGAYLPLFLTYHPKVPEYQRDLLREQPDRNRIYEVSADGDWWEFLVEYGIIGVALLGGMMLLSAVLWLRLDGIRCVNSLYLNTAALLVVLHGIIDRILRDEIVLAMLGVTFALAIRTAQAHWEARMSRRSSRIHSDK